MSCLFKLILSLLLAGTLSCSDAQSQQKKSSRARPVINQTQRVENQTSVSLVGSGSTEPKVAATSPESSFSVKVIRETVVRAINGDICSDCPRRRQDGKGLIHRVDTPESTTKVEPYSGEASDYTKKALSGKKVYLEVDVRERGKYG